MNLMFVLASRGAAALLLLSTAFHASAAVGALDPTFVSSKPPECINDPNLFSGADGSFYVSCRNTATEQIVIKYTDRGTIDTRWGENGVARHVAPPCATCFLRLGIEDQDGGVRLVLPDGRSLHFHLDGKPDLAYGRASVDGAGILGDSIIEPGGLTSFAIQPDGGLLALSAMPLPIVSGGYFPPDNNNYHDTLIVRRLLPNGRRDTAFGDAGELRYRYLFSRGSNFGYGFSKNNMPITSGELVTWSLLPDNRLEVLFTTLPNVNARQQPLQAVSLVAGGLDPTATGRAFPAPGVGGWMHPELRVLPDGSQLFARYEVTKWQPDGGLDLSFGITGRGSTPIGTCESIPALSLLAGGNIANYSYNAEGFAHLCVTYATYLGAITAAGQRISGSGASIIIGGSPTLINRAGKLVTLRLYRELNVRDGNLVRFEGEGPRAEVAVIEYYHPQLDHYFMTATELEIELLDNNPATGWRRTGYRFGAWNIDTPMPGTEGVCRYYGDLAAGPNSHFYSAEKFECDILAALEAKSPVATRAWRFERDAFRITVPMNGKCPAALLPVYRVYNRGTGEDKDPNHRYLTSAVEYQAMLDSGWVDEGVHMCATPNSGM